ncbi:hypothetical protein [Actinokineospora cianjurensis]|uniref:CorA-like Mg2+ transporter protein n=1 Tax=Actinokineospora cianjurensis TaxID=585224 RepID=A0A421B2K7_9PSEU|nr:hypothetical protein [Actinokineospora cianjurensis]RLK58498.1 hypothetical protein CLV68_2965 [Actinokineospora cianjurensis]
MGAQHDDAELTALRAAGGRQHFTLSLLVAHERLQQALREQTTDLEWNKDLVRELRSHQDSSELSQAIEPLFSDIADRKRGLFVEDFLIDTASVDPGLGLGPNIRDVISLTVPRQITWSTEGETLRADFDTAVEFTEVRCRAFWVAHSNFSLSYHLSFEIPYQHTAAHYFALSLVQKVFFPTEGTDTLHVEGLPTVMVDSRFGSTPTSSLPAFVREQFMRDADELFETVFTVKKDKVDVKRVMSLTREKLAMKLLEPEDEPEPRAEKLPQTVPPMGGWNRKAVSVLEDPYFFALLDPGTRAALEDVDQVDPTTIDGVDVYRQAVLDDCDPEHLAYYFLSGFFQNVIDFLRQDISEVQDGTDPIYPPPEADSGYSIVYASPTSLYQVIAEARSLRQGRPWIGTCPYLFLVHLMTMHNEDLVRRYEQQVRTLITHMDDVRHLASDEERRRSWRRDWSSDLTFERFRRFRLDRFDEIQRHRYFNVLRYDTERAFYEDIERVRGIHQREQYWAEVVTELETTVDDLHSAQKRTVDDKRNRLLGIVTVVGILQVAFQVLDYFFEDRLDATKLEYAFGMIAAALVIAVVYFRPARTPKAPTLSKRRLTELIEQMPRGPGRRTRRRRDMPVPVVKPRA